MVMMNKLKIRMRELTERHEYPIWVLVVILHAIIYVVVRAVEIILLFILSIPLIILAIILTIDHYITKWRDK